MKKSVFFALLTTLVLTAVSCVKPKVESTLTVTPAKVTIAAVSQQAETITITTNADWTAVAADSWVSVSPASGSGNAVISVSAEPNVAPEGQAAPARKSTLTISIDGKKTVAQIEQQKETMILSISGGETTVPASGASVMVNVSANTTYTVASSESWCALAGEGGTKAVQNKSLKFVVAQNKTGLERTAFISFTSVDKLISQEVHVRQEAGELIEDFSGGKGTQAEPYVISTVEDLKSFSEKTNNPDTRATYLDMNYVLGADIDMSKAGDFTPIAQKASNAPFMGSFDGKGHKISGLRIRSTVNEASGLFAYCKNASVKNLELADADIDCNYVMCGSTVGYAENCTIEGITFTGGQIREYVSDITYESEAQNGLCGGLVGYAKNSAFKSCTMAGNATFYGKNCGGIVGKTEDCTIEDCHVMKDVTLNFYYHFQGGLVGRAVGSKTLIKSCSFEGNMSVTGYTLGGMVGQLQGGTVTECVVGSYATLGCDKYAVGGIVGHTAPVYDIIIDKCAVYGDIKGQHTVGGIVGFTGSGATVIGGAVSGSTKSVTITGCAYIGGELTGTGNNGGANLYTLVAGITGWNSTGGTISIKGCYSNPAIVQSTSAGNRGGIGGVTGYMNNATSASFSNLYSTVSQATMLNCNDPAQAKSNSFVGPIYARVTTSLSLKDCYYDAEYGQAGPQEGKTTESSCQGLSTAQMSDGTLLKLLQSSADGVTWVKGSDGLPTISGIPADPNVRPKAAKRVSIIGDSISTFRGWVPGGYSCHYPATDGTLTLVNETYWYRLIYDYMKNARFDMNIAFSGSTVTNTTEANYKTRYGTATNAWWHNCFTERFRDCGGCGRPDIILIHGGTNDWAHNADPLYPGSPISKNASTPSASTLDAIFKVADAAKTRSEVNALPDGTFCEAYAKLLCQIRERYPKCKVVCIIGDYLSEPFEQSMLMIAEHYGAKTVDLLAVNGFNDQTYMPKHDFNGTSGCHPGSQAMKFMAEKIYKELGSWLEQ